MLRVWGWKRWVGSREGGFGLMRGGRMTLSTSSLWKTRRGKDEYSDLARAEGTRSRAAYKLEELVKKRRVLRKGDFVVDLGAAPGGWSVVAARAVGGRGGGVYRLGMDVEELWGKEKGGKKVGKVVGVDLLPFAPIPGVCGIFGDFCDPIVEKAILDVLGRKPNVVLSDVAHSFIGDAKTDYLKQMDLAHEAWHFAQKHLKSKGNFVVKVRQGPDTKSFEKELKQYFKAVNLDKPKASQSRSAEIYLVATHFNSKGRE